MKYNDYPDASSNRSFDVLSKVYASASTLQAKQPEKQPVHSYAFERGRKYRGVPFAKRSTHDFLYGYIKTKSVCSGSIKEKLEDVVISYERVKPLIVKSNRQFPFALVEQKLSSVMRVLPVGSSACLSYKAKPVTMFRYEQELSNLVQSLIDLIGAVLTDLEQRTLVLSPEEVVALLKDLHTILSTIFEKLSD